MSEESTGDEGRSEEVIDLSSPIRGKGGVMYPLTYWRTEEVDLDFVLDVNDEELVAASDVTMQSGGKAGFLWMICVVLLIDVVFVHFCLKLMQMEGVGSLVALLAIVVSLSIPFCIWVLRAIKYKNRIEPVVFNRVDQTVTHYGEGRTNAVAWGSLKPFIRIVRVVGTAGGAQVELLVLAELDEASGRVKSEIVVGRGDVIAAGSLRYAFFRAYMHGSHEDLPGFRLVSIDPGWMKRIALSLWMVPALRWRWLGEKPWSPWIGLASVFNTVVALPLLMSELVAARISLEPHGQSSLGPWHKRFDGLAPDSTLRKLARPHGDMVVQARRCLIASVAIGGVFWLIVLVLLGMVFRI